MHPDKWPEIKEKIKESFEVLADKLEQDEGRREEKEIIEFNGPAGKMRVEWVARPKVLEQKTQYSNRIGSSVGVETVYSETEVTHTFRAFKWDDGAGDWQEMSANLFS